MLASLLESAGRPPSGGSSSWYNFLFLARQEFIGNNSVIVVSWAAFAYPGLPFGLGAVPPVFC